jgi:hypothetical protein
MATPERLDAHYNLVRAGGGGQHAHALARLVWPQQQHLTDVQVQVVLGSGKGCVYTEFACLCRRGATHVHT